MSESQGLRNKTNILIRNSKLRRDEIYYTCMLMGMLYFNSEQRLSARKIHV